MNVDKLDDAFLFVLGLGTLGFTIIQTTVGGTNGALNAIPVLISGVILPFYIGYVRGALSNNTVERIRGWIYLVVGSFVTLAMLLADFEDLNWLGPLKQWGLFLFAVPGLLLARPIAKKLLAEFPLEDNLRTRIILLGGSVAAFMAPLFSIVFLTLVNFVITIGTNLALWSIFFGLLWPTLFLFSIYVIAERTCQSMYIVGATRELGLDEDRFAWLSELRTRDRIQSLFRTNPVIVRLLNWLHRLRPTAWLLGRLRTSRSRVDVRDYFRLTELDLLLRYLSFTYPRARARATYYLLMASLVLLGIPTSLHLGSSYALAVYASSDGIIIYMLATYLSLKGLRALK